MHFNRNYLPAIIGRYNVCIGTPRYLFLYLPKSIFNRIVKKCYDLVVGDTIPMDIAGYL